MWIISSGGTRQQAISDPMLTHITLVEPLFLLGHGRVITSRKFMFGVINLSTPNALLAKKGRCRFFQTDIFLSRKVSVYRICKFNLQKSEARTDLVVARLTREKIHDGTKKRLGRDNSILIGANWSQVIFSCHPVFFFLSWQRIETC